MVQSWQLDAHTMTESLVNLADARPTEHPTTLHAAPEPYRLNVPSSGFTDSGRTSTGNSPPLTHSPLQVRRPRRYAGMAGLQEACVRANIQQQLGTCWAEAHIKIARMTLTIKLDGNWSSFQLANSAPPLSVTDSAIAPSARMPISCASGAGR